VGEVEPRFGKADVLDRVRSRDGHEERLRVRHADVLGGVDDQAPCDEAGVLAAFEHEAR
jgi:hypothetical protein